MNDDIMNKREQDAYLKVSGNILKNIQDRLFANEYYDPDKEPEKYENYWRAKKEYDSFIDSDYGKNNPFVQAQVKQYLAEQDKELQPDFSTGTSGKIITSKSIQVDESYIYVFYKQDGFRGIRLGVYDWDGNLVKNIEYVNNSIYNYGTDDFSNGDFCILNNESIRQMSS